MQSPPSLHKISVTWRGKKFVVEMNSGATVKELGQELQELTNIQEDTMRLIIPQVSNKASKLMSPFSTEHAFLSLQEASITEAKSIKMMGVSTNEVEQVLQDAKANLRIAGFEDEEKRLKQRSSYGPHVSWKLPQGPYIFNEFRTLEIPGVKLNPPPSEALKRMHMLAADPGIIAVMNKHRWRVGIMTEMAPIGYVGVSPKCILGFNKNHGDEISLRLRTDDLRGFRKYESIKKTLLHELAHMVYSEHDANFYALDKQLNLEAVSLDWTRSASHTLSGVRNSDYFEGDFVRDSSYIPQKLGGNRSDQLISARAFSVAAAYHRMTTASAIMAGGSELNAEPDPDDSRFNMSGEPDHMNSQSKEIMDIDMTFHAEEVPNSEPDPDDCLTNVMKHEPDPDDSHHVKSFSYDICSGITDTGMTSHAEKGPNSEPDPDDQLANVRKHEPDPDGSHHVKAFSSDVFSGITDNDMTLHVDHLANVMKHDPGPDDLHHVKAFSSDVCSGIIDTGMAEKGPNSEPDPDDHLANVMKHEPDPDDSHHVKAFNSDVFSGITEKRPISEPVPDDSIANVMKHEPDPDDSYHAKAFSSDVFSGITDTDMTFHADKGSNSEPDPDDQLANVMKHEPDPDDSHHVKAFSSDIRLGITDSIEWEAEKNNLMHNSEVFNSLGSVVTINVGPQVIESRDSKEPAHNEPNADVVVPAEPDPDDIAVPPAESSTMQTDEPDPDDLELQRINDPVTIVCNHLQKNLEVLKAEVSPMQTASAIQTLLKIIRNVIEHPEETKYKRLRKANPVIERNVVNNKATLEILFLVGFKEDVIFDEMGKAEAYLVLKRNDPGLLWLAKSSLESYTDT